MIAIRLEGPFETSFSFSIVNRAFAAALATTSGVELGIRPMLVPGNGVVRRSNLPPEDALAASCETAAARQADWVVRLAYPPVVEAPEPGARLVLSFPWEESLVAGDWVDRFHRDVALVLVPSRHVHDVLRASGLALPIAVVPLGLDAPLGGEEGEALEIPTSKRFRFLHVSSGFSRKGCDVLLRAYREEFSRSDDVCLIVKTLPQFDHDVATRVRRARWRPRAPEIVHIDRDVGPRAIDRLLRDASCLVHPARAEGFALPVAEAMRAGVPVIVTRFGGMLDFCTDETATLVGGRLVQARKPESIPGALWLEPDVGQLRAAMREHYERAGAPEIRARVERARAAVASFTWERAAQTTVRAFGTLEAADQRRVRAGMIGTWNVRCGFAEYARALVEHTASAELEWTILAAEGDPVAVDGPEVVRCWRENDPATLLGAVREATTRGLELVHFHWHLRELRPVHATIVTRLRHAGIRVLATIHSTSGVRLPAVARMAGLGALDRLFVHTPRDRAALEGVGLRANLSVLPHGFPVPRAESSGASVARRIEGAPVIATVGFLRPHKGVVELLEAVARVRRRHRDVAFLALTSLYPDRESTAYLERCLATVRARSLEERARFVTEFLPEEGILAELQAADVVVLPYAPTIDSASGAVRLAMASGRPVVTCRRPVFEDVANEVHTIGRASPRAIARGILEVLEEPRRTTLVARAAERCARDAWPRIGATYARLVRAAVNGTASPRLDP